MEINYTYDITIEVVSITPAITKITIANPTSIMLSFVTDQNNFEFFLMKAAEIMPPAIAPMN